MIAAGDGAGYIQSGFGREYGKSPVYYAEDNVNGGATYHRRLTTTVIAEGSTQQYWEQYTTQSGGTCFGGTYRENVNTTILQTAGFCPFSSWARPFSPQFAGEGINANDDIPGTSASGMLFSQIQTQNNVNNIFSAYLPPMSPANTQPTHNYNPGGLATIVAVSILPFTRRVHTRSAAAMRRSPIILTVVLVGTTACSQGTAVLSQSAATASPSDPKLTTQTTTATFARDTEFDGMASAIVGQRFIRTFSFDHGTQSIVPLPATYIPKVTATDVLAASKAPISAQPDTSASTPILGLGSMTVTDYGTDSGTGISPSIENRPVWLVVYNNVADPEGPIGALNSSPKPLPPELSQFKNTANVTQIFDAVTGTQLLGGVYSVVQPVQ